MCSLKTVVWNIATYPLPTRGYTSYNSLFMGEKNEAERGEMAPKWGQVVRKLWGAWSGGKEHEWRLEKSAASSLLLCLASHRVCLHVSNYHGYVLLCQPHPTSFGSPAFWEIYLFSNKVLYQNPQGISHICSGSDCPNSPCMVSLVLCSRSWSTVLGPDWYSWYTWVHGTSRSYGLIYFAMVLLLMLLHVLGVAASHSSLPSPMVLHRLPLGTLFPLMP